MSFLFKHHRLLFYGCWLFLGLVQSGLTELQDDEAYYWVYGQYLDWGYFDHPPMIGLLIKMGYAIFPNELGVRLFPLLLNVLSLVLIEKLLEKKNPLLFYVIALSVAVLQITGFAAVPDTPLIFFTALFFYCYKKFNITGSWLHTILLGMSIALLCYSKYHAVLIVVFTLLSQVRLLGKIKAWAAVLIAILLFAPHLWWQYQHDWVSFRYHLFESNVNAYKPSFTLNYILGQLLLPGPIAGFILLPAAFLHKPFTKTERALRFTMIGVYAFFLLSSFRGKVEANWTSPAIVPLMVLSHQWLCDQLKWRKLLIKLLPITLLLVLLARVIMIENVLTITAIEHRYHAWKKWPQQLREKTKGLPVVFSNSYQRASKYWFYSGQPTYSLNHYRERKNNYNLWPVEDSLLGKPACYFDIYDLYRFEDSLQTPSMEIGWKYDPAFVSFAKINVAVTPAKVEIKENETISLTTRFTIPPHYAEYLRAHPSAEDTIRVGLFNTKGWIQDIFPAISLNEMLVKKEVSFSFDPGLPTGKYYLRVAINRGYRNPTHNSNKIELLIK
jgi:hypothetical protein